MTREKWIMHRCPVLAFYIFYVAIKLIGRRKRKDIQAAWREET